MDTEEVGERWSEYIRELFSNYEKPEIDDELLAF